VIENIQVAKDISKHLLQINAIKLNPKNPFTWASGIKSPIYCDNRLILSEVNVRKYVTEKFCELIDNKFSDVEIIAGVATGAIGIGMLIANQLNKPFIYVRANKKSHGRQNTIEGKFNPNEKVLVIEDLVSTGMSSLNAYDALIGGGLNVLGMVSIFTYGFDDAISNFEKRNISYYSLSSYTYLLESALKSNYINKNEINFLSQWRKDPKNWK
jgi:orotate phosphoribosyltransferase